MWSISLNSLSPTSLSIVFGPPIADQIQPAFASQFGDLVGGVHRVVAADVDEVADVVGFEDVDATREILRLLLLQLVAAGADRSGGRRVAQQRDLVGRLGGQIEQFFLQHAFDAVVSPVDGADFRHLASGLDDAAQRVVDDRTGAAALGDHQVLGGTHWHFSNRCKDRAGGLWQAESI